MDILTQLQSCLDQLATQLYASLHYLSTHHPGQDPSPNGGPSQPTANTPPAQATSTNEDTPSLFTLRQRELSRDLIFKEQQIEHLVSVLPGISRREEEQESRIRELEGELRQVEGEKDAARGILRERLEKLEGVLGGLGRG